jgi:2-polyprenyl-3-methyl-5-hydroxy-6-metoxy-1,4-benzoquinol methylase
MKTDFLELLVCPQCCGKLELNAVKTAGSEMEAGRLTCMNNHSFDIVRGIPRFAASDGYAENFGFEWNLHNKTQLDTATNHDSEESFEQKTGFTPEELSGKVVLDVGCGMGRYSDVASRWGATVVGIDLTSAVDAAQSNIGDRKNVNLAQADIFKLPFADKTFDYIFSIGVLHHTPDTKAAFDQLPRLLKPGGKIAVWIYSTEMLAWCWTSDIYRRLTTRLPKRALYALCHVAIPWHHLRNLPIVGPYTGKVLPVSTHPSREWRVLNTFDWYSPAYQWKHSVNELRDWFENQGMIELRTLEFPTSVQGTRPSTSNGSSRGATDVPVGEMASRRLEGV